MQACKKAAQSALSESKTMRKETDLGCLHSERELLSNLNAWDVSESLWIVQSLAELRRSCWRVAREETSAFDVNRKITQLSLCMRERMSAP